MATQRAPTAEMRKAVAGEKEYQMKPVTELAMSVQIEFHPM